jgi:hypothetical protein
MMKYLRLLYRCLSRIPSIELEKILQGSYALGYFDRDYLKAVQTLLLRNCYFSCEDITRLIKVNALTDTGKLEIVLALSQRCIDPYNLVFMHLAFSNPRHAALVLSRELGIKILG